MGCLGVLFSIDEETKRSLTSLPSDETKLDLVRENIEEHYFSDHPQWVCELDKSWDALHRTLTDGKLEWRNGTYPLNHVVLGGSSLYNETDYIMVLKTPEQVSDIFNAFDSVTKDIFKKNYFKINPASYGLEISEEDFEYTWNWFSDSRNFWKLASEEKRYVLFTADQ